MSLGLSVSAPLETEEQRLIRRFARLAFEGRQWLVADDFEPGMGVRDNMMALLIEYRDFVIGVGK